jgi:hypothetical protein
MGLTRNAYRVLVGMTEKKGPLRRPDTGGRIILKWILEKQNGVTWTGIIWLKI